MVRKRQLLWKKQNPKAWLRLRAGQKARYYRQFQKNIRHKGERWTPVEDARITAKGPTDRKLSKSLGRSVQPIQQRRWCLSRSQSNCNGAELLCPLSKMFAIFDVMCSVNKDESWVIARFARRENFLPDTYDFVLFGVRRTVGNLINARSGNLISRLIRLSPDPYHPRLLCEGPH